MKRNNKEGLHTTITCPTKTRSPNHLTKRWNKQQSRSVTTITCPTKIFTLGVLPNSSASRSVIRIYQIDCLSEFHLGVSPESIKNACPNQKVAAQTERSKSFAQQKSIACRVNEGRDGWMEQKTKRASSQSQQAKFCLSHIEVFMGFSAPCSIRRVDGWMHGWMERWKEERRLSRWLEDGGEG